MTPSDLPATDDSWPAPETDPPSEWSPPAWLMQVSRGMVQLIIFTAYVAVTILCIATFSGSDFALLLAIGAVALGGAVTIAVHELGHLAAAKLAGAYVYGVQIGFVDALATRRGWRLRWKRPQFVHGMVMFFPHPAKPIERQCFVASAGGPAANLVVAGLSGILTTRVPPEVMGLLAALAILNAATGVANLLPTQKHWPSDGLQLLRLLKRCAFTRTSLAFLRLNGLAMSGVTADRLPTSDIEALEAGTPVERLLGLWFRVKAAQACADAGGIHLSDDRLNSCTAALGESERTSCGLLATMIRYEIAFSAALDQQSRIEQLPLRSELDREIDWHAPALRPRCRALHAVLSGDFASARRLLEEARVASEASADPSLRESECRLRGRIEKLAPTLAAITSGAG